MNIISLALVESPDCPRASEGTLKNLGEIDQMETKHKKV